MTYQIKRVIKLYYFPYWLVYLLYDLDPRVYEACDNIEDCISKLNQIEESIKQSSVRYNRTEKSLVSFRKIVRTRNSLSLISSKNQVNVIFKIEQYDKSVFNLDKVTS